MSKVKEFQNHDMKLDGEQLLTTYYVIEKICMSQNLMKCVIPFQNVIKNCFMVGYIEQQFM